MSTKQQNSLAPNRRSFLKTSAATAASLFGAGSLWADEKKKLRVLFVGAGNRARANIGELAKHPQVVLSAFVDVNEEFLKPLREKYPDAIFAYDYREVFAKHLDQFDAVVVSTPDHMHAPVMLLAMENDKHVYGEKPLVHQLDEIRMIRKAVAAKPQVVTQMGNQRVCHQPKVELARMLQNGDFGTISEAWAWSNPMQANQYFLAPYLDEYPPSAKAPETAHWDLWLGCSREKLPFTPEIFVKKWRSCWEYGSGMMGDWTPHIIDTTVYGMQLEKGPKAVITKSGREAAKVTVGADYHSQLLFEGVKASGGKDFTVHVTDGVTVPKAEKYGLPADIKLGRNTFMIVSEAATIVSTAGGENMKFYKDGKDITGEFKRPTVDKHHHWHDWVDNCLGAKKHLWSPFNTGALITELSLLPAKTTLFPGKELEWDSAACRFTNHEEANAKIVKRDYREGFGVPKGYEA